MPIRHPLNRQTVKPFFPYPFSLLTSPIFAFFILIFNFSSCFPVLLISTSCLPDYLINFFFFHFSLLILLFPESLLARRTYGRPHVVAPLIIFPFFLSLLNSFMLFSAPKDLMDNCGFLLITLALPSSTVERRATSNKRRLCRPRNGYRLIRNSLCLTGIVFFRYKDKMNWQVCLCRYNNDIYKVSKRNASCKTR